MIALPLLAALLSASAPAQTVHPSDCPHHQSAAAADSASHSPYVGQETRTVKALSDDEQAQLIAGHGMGLARAAELNHYPGPKHVIELEAALALTEDQLAQARTAFDEVQERAQALGREIVDREGILDARFAAGQIDEAGLAEAIREIGRLQGELRLTHLRAHLKTRAAMTPEQIALYDRLRGYVAAEVAPE